MEKFQTFRRGKTLIFSAFFLILMTLVFNACRNELDFGQPYSTETGGLSKQITEVKEWFETNYHFEPSKITDVKRFGKIEPIWNKAILENGVLEVPIMMNNQMTLPSLYEGFAYKGKQRLMISEKGGVKNMYIVNLMPSKDFKGQMKDVTALNYRKKSFDGLISAYSLNGESMGGYLFKQGTLTKKLKEINKNNNALKNGLSTRGSCKCFVSVYECHCGRVNGGELQCSICVDVTCYGDCSGGGDPDPEPPGDCEDDPLCGIDPDPNPDPIDPNDDPCKGNNPPPDCPCKCISKYQSSIPYSLDLKLVIVYVNHKAWGSNVCEDGEHQTSLTVSQSEAFPFQFTNGDESDIEIDNSPGSKCTRNILHNCSGTLKYGAGDLIFFSDPWNGRAGYRFE